MKLPERLERIQRFWKQEIWNATASAAAIPPRIRLARLLAITYHGVLQNGILTRAAALSYSTLLSLGPLVVIVVLISSSFWPSDAEDQIKRLLIFLAPSLGEYMRLDGAASGAVADSELDTLISEVINGAQNTLNGIDTSGSGIFGIVGLLTLIWIVIQLLTTIENTLNDIWGVKKGREWGYRIVFYWTFISLGTILGLGTGAFISASLLGGFLDWLPSWLPLWLRESDLLISLVALLPPLVILSLLLTFFYLLFPNTQVHMRPALLGGTVAAVLLIANNYASTFYVGQVIRIQNLYGSVAIVPVLMLGLYFSWMLVLLGGQISYAAQNVTFLADQNAWDRSSQLVRQSLTLGALLFICRRFHHGEPPTALDDLAAHLRAPRNQLNESINRLVGLGLLSKVPDESPDVADDFRYQPAKPLKRLRLAEIHRDLERYGNNAGQELVEQVDPLLARYLDARDRQSSELGDTTLEELFDREAARA